MKNFSKVITVVMLLMLSCSLYSQKDDTYYIKRAQKLHRHILTIDTHNDAAMRINNPFGRYAQGSKGQVTFELMKEGGLDAAVFAIYIRQGNRDSISSVKAAEFVKDQLSKLKIYTLENSKAALAYSGKDLRYNKRKKKTSVILGIENGYAIGKDLNNIKLFRDSGVSMMTICHSYNNDICDSSTDTTGREFGGLSPFGEKVVQMMNKEGIIIDVSHASKETVLDVLKISNKPIIASHSGVYAINPSPRNLTDEEIKGIAAGGGVIQVVSLRSYLSSKPKELVSVADMADHVDYIKKLVGIEHVGVGTDFDGGGGVNGMEDASKMTALTAELLKRGYTKRELRLFWGENLLRVLKANKRSK